MQRFAVTALAGAVLAGVAIPAAAAGASPGPAVSVVRSGLNNPRHLTLTGRRPVGGPSRARVPGRDIQLRHRPVHRRGRQHQLLRRPDRRRVAHPARPHRGLVPLPSVIQTDSSEVAGPAAVTFSHGRSAVIMQDVLVNSHGVNALPEAGREAVRPAADPLGPQGHRGEHRGLRGGPPAVGLEPGHRPGRDGLRFRSLRRRRLPRRLPGGRRGRELAAAGLAVRPDPPAGPFPGGHRDGPGRGSRPGAGDGQGPGRADLHRGRTRTGRCTSACSAACRRSRARPTSTGSFPATSRRSGPAASPPSPSIAFDGHGRLLATEYSTGGLLSPPTTPGALVRISHHGHTVTTLPVCGLFQPTGVAVGSNGAVYVSNYGGSTATATHPGEILKITGLR